MNPAYSLPFPCGHARYPDGWLVITFNESSRDLTFPPLVNMTLGMSLTFHSLFLHRPWRRVDRQLCCRRKNMGILHAQILLQKYFLGELTFELRSNLKNELRRPEGWGVRKAGRQVGAGKNVLDQSDSALQGCC